MFFLKSMFFAVLAKKLISVSLKIHPNQFKMIFKNFKLIENFQKKSI